jgi:lipopolysaccharide assembly protein A
MRYIKYIFLGLLGLCLLTVALANRGPVQIRLLPEDMAALIGVNWSADVPLFLVIFGGILVGLLIGFVWEWLREHRIRAEAARTRRQLTESRREIEQLREAQPKGAGDDVLALLDDGGRSR